MRPRVALLAALCLAAAAGCRPPANVPIAGTFPIAEPGWEPPAPMRNWTHIVIHHSATHRGNARLFDRHHRHVRRWENGLGYHFVIGNGDGSGDGQVEVGHRWRRQMTGAHVGGRLNIGKVGVCLVGNFQTEEPTAAQMRSLHRLLSFLQSRCQIPASRVVGHCELCGRKYTACPGRNFSMSALRARLPAVPTPYRAGEALVRHR